MDIILYRNVYKRFLHVNKAILQDLNEFLRGIQVEVRSNEWRVEWYSSFGSQMQELLTIMLLQTYHF